MSGIVTRRDFLKKSATGIITSLAFPNILLAKDRGKHERSLNLVNVNTDESVNVVYFADGKYIYEGLVALDRIFRDFHENKIVPMDVMLYEMVYGIQYHSDKRYPLLLSSGYRTKKTNIMLKNMHFHVAENSFHIKAKAGDLTVYKKARVPIEKLHSYATHWKLGGVGFYPGQNFMHLDTGNPRSWIS